MHHRARGLLFASLLLFAGACSRGTTGDICTPDCSSKTCGDDGCGGSCGSCGDGEICDAAGACTSCGNGTLDDGETCDDSADAADCPTEALCVPDNPCFVPTYSGSPETCDAVCETEEITECGGDDGCCPANCTPGDDLDCAPDTCGNGKVDIGETCDPPEVPCVDSCEPESACQIAEFHGFAQGCNITCSRVDITECEMVGDGCCPDGCTYRTDADCPAPVCGDGVVSGDETCDRDIPDGDEGACPADCDDNYACTTDLATGDVADCSAACEHSRTSACLAGDGCCPPACTSAQDADCDDVTCGDGVVDGDEGCDNAIAAGESGACPATLADCDDGDPCTTDALDGDAADCSAHCVNTPMACADGDGCCPYTCSPSADAECAQHDPCDEYCVLALTYCQGANQLYASTAECQAACAQMPVGRDGDVSGDSIACRVHHLGEARIDPDTHCPHGSQNPPEVCVDP